ncbi:MAG: exosortase B [Sterolibacteriaceae bacterium]|nr:exosortase B [Candidatus Methylophosphatis haderslevensis]
MSAVVSNKGPHQAALVDWLPVAVGLAALYVPTFLAFATTIWQTEQHAHGPLIVAVVAWLVWDNRRFFGYAPTGASPLIGWSLVLLGLMSYMLGRSQTIPLLDIGSFIPVAAGAILVLRGWPGLKMLWFPILFSAFAIPLPGLIVDAATGPLKQSVSSIAESILYVTGYPIARSGIVLNVGQYQLLVADACSGLNSMFSLSALGLVYLYLMRYRSFVHVGLLVACILPIAFAANIVRVMILVLVTYHFGDEAGQGFIHGFAGMILFLVALLMLFGFDSLLGVFLKPRKAA